MAVGGRRECACILRHRENDFILSIGCFSFLLLLFDVMGTEIHAPEIPEGGLSGAYAPLG